MKISYNWLANHLQIANGDVSNKGAVIADLAIRSCSQGGASQSQHTVDLLVSTLNSIGHEVEELVDYNKIYQNFVIAEIVATEPHPNADKLQICQVQYDPMLAPISVVCGALNARPGIKVILAQTGAIVPNNGMIIKKAKIRNIESNGMLCSAEELSLQNDQRYSGISEGIIELPADAPVGEKFAIYAGFDDVYFDIGLTPNRKRDCASVFGIARDLAAAGVGCLVQEDVDPVILDKINNLIRDHGTESFARKEKGNSYSFGNANDSVEILDSRCKEIVFLPVSDLDMSKLVASRIKNIRKNLSITKNIHKNDLVNISNYVMFTYGRPSHIYDAGKICGKISVRSSQLGEKFTAIGGQEYQLPEGLIVIADDEKVLAVAGVIGGESSKVDEATTNILIEVANFDFLAVMEAGRALGIRTESRMRFESGVDPKATAPTLGYIADILKEAGEIRFDQLFYCVNDDYGRQDQTEVVFSHQEICEIIGREFSQEYIDQTLAKLGFIITPVAEKNPIVNSKLINTASKYQAVIPSWRQGEIDGVADLAEEVLRIYGLDNLEYRPFNIAESQIIQAKQNSGPDYKSKSNNKSYVVEKIRNIMVERGFFETINWSFYSKEDSQIFGFNLESRLEQTQSNQAEKHNHELHDSQTITITNPINANFTEMRQTLLPHLLNGVAKNAARSYHNISLFEIGPIYGWDLGDKKQAQVVSGVRSGNCRANSIHSKQRCWDFYDVRDDFMKVVTAACSNRVGFNLSGFNDFDHFAFDLVLEAPIYYHPKRSIAIYYSDILLGYCGEIHPNIAKKFDLKNINAFEVLLENVEAAYQVAEKKYRQKIANVCSNLVSSAYQSVQRDLAFITSQNTSAADLVKVARNISEQNRRFDNIMQNIEIFDVYNGDKLEKNQKSLALRFTMQAIDRTLIDDEINNVLSVMKNEICNQLGCILRDF